MVGGSVVDRLGFLAGQVHRLSAGVGHGANRGLAKVCAKSRGQGSTSSAQEVALRLGSSLAQDHWCPLFAQSTIEVPAAECGRGSGAKESGTDILAFMTPPTMVPRRLAGVGGVAAVSLMLFGTRWGSYLGYAPLFLTDILLVGAFLYWIAAESTAGSRKNHGRLGNPGLPLIVFLFFVIVRAVMSPYALTMDWARDLIPFLYSVVAFLSAATYAKTGPLGRDRTMRLLWWALNGHLAWTLIVNFAILDPTALPMIPRSGITILTQRPDIDMAVLGMTAALYVRRLMINCHRKWSLGGLVLSMIATVGFESRAGLLAVLAAMTLAYLCTLAVTQNVQRKLNWMMMAPVILMAAAFAMPQTEVGERLLATVGLEEAVGAHQKNALGTANARDQAWEQIIEWTGDDTTRALVGVGFGPNFVQESGAEAALAGTTYEGVRSPHNWFVGVYARMGLLGLGLTAFVMLTTLLHVWNIRRAVGGSELLTLAAAGVIAILIVATLGVVLESPFGAVPFWWFLGILVSERRLSWRSPNVHQAPYYYRKRQRKNEADSVVFSPVTLLYRSRNSNF